MAERAPLVHDRSEYERLYKWSIDDPQDFWASMAQDYFWAKKVGVCGAAWVVPGGGVGGRGMCAVLMMGLIDDGAGD